MTTDLATPEPNVAWREVLPIWAILRLDMYEIKGWRDNLVRIEYDAHENWFTIFLKDETQVVITK